MRGIRAYFFLCSELSRGPEAWVDHYAGQVALALRGSHQTLRCRIRLTRPAKGMRAGGSGECQLSGGGDISLTLPGTLVK